MISSRPQISAIEMPHLDRVFQMEQGYVLDFSYRTFASFFAEQHGIDINEKQYAAFGTSKAKRLRCFVNTATPHLVAALLRSLLKYREELHAHAASSRSPTASKPEAVEQLSLRKVEEIIERLESGASSTDGIDAFTDDFTLEALVASIERDIGAQKPEVALDRLHTYCMKKFAHLLATRGEPVFPKDTLNARAGRYFNPLRREGRVRPISDRIMKSTVEIFEYFNHVRNNESLAHDNKLVEPDEALYIFNSVVNLLRFVRSIEGKSFGN